MKDRVWQVYDMIIMPGLLCPAVPHGWREVGGSAVWRHPTCNVKVSLKDDFFIGTPDRSSLSHGHVHMLSLCTDFCSGFDIFMYFLTASSAILLLTSQVTIWIRVGITYARFWLSFTLEFIVFCKFFCCVNVITGYWSCLFFCLHLENMDSLFNMAEAMGPWHSFVLTLRECYNFCKEHNNHLKAQKCHTRDSDQKCSEKTFVTSVLTGPRITGQRWRDRSRLPPSVN